MRKMVIPYSQFLPGTKILAEHFNTNFDEVEYVFNEMQGDYTEYKKFIQENYMTADNIDLAYDTTFVPGEKIDNEVLGGFVFTDYETCYAFDDEAVTYQFELADNYQFSNPISVQENLVTPQAFCEALPAGQYFFRVTCRNESGYTQTAMAEYEAEDETTYYGVICFYINADGTIVRG